MPANTKMFFTSIKSSSSYTPFNNKSIICPSDNLFITLASNFANYYITNNFTNFNNLLPKLTTLQQTYPNYKESTISATVVNLINCLSAMININNNLNDQLLFLENNNLYIIKQPQIVVQNQIINQNANIKLVYMQYLLMYDITASNGIFLDTYLANAQKVLNYNRGKIVSNKTVLKTFL